MIRNIFRFLARLILLPFYILDDFIKLNILPSSKGLYNYLIKGYIGGKH